MTSIDRNGMSVHGQKGEDSRKITEKVASGHP